MNLPFLHLLTCLPLEENKLRNEKLAIQEEFESPATPRGEGRSTAPVYS